MTREWKKCVCVCGKYFYSCYLFADKEDDSSMSVFILLKNPSVMITGLMILIAASGIGFLEPTLAIQLKEVCSNRSQYHLFEYKHLQKHQIAKFRFRHFSTGRSKPKSWEDSNCVFNSDNSANIPKAFIPIHWFYTYHYKI